MNLIEKVILTYDTDWVVTINDKEQMSIGQFWDKYVCEGTEFSEPVIEDDYIIADDFLYLKDPTSVEQVIKAISYFEQGEPEYDTIANHGRGWASSSTRDSIVGRDGAYVSKVGTFEDYKIKPLSEFHDDNPNFNVDNYHKIMDALDEYYAKSMF